MHVDVADAPGKDFLPLLQAGPVLVELGLSRGYFFFCRRQVSRYRPIFALGRFQALLDFIELVADVVDDHLGLGLLFALLGHAGLDVVQLVLQVIVGKGQEARRQQGCRYGQDNVFSYHITPSYIVSAKSYCPRRR